MMRIYLFILIITSNVYSQEDKILDSKLNSFTKVCRDIGGIVLNKEAKLNISNWCENLALEKAQSYITELRIDITSDNVIYSILLLKNEAPIFYTINFYDKNTLEEFGQLFIAFKDKENTLIDNINYISKEEQNKSKANNKTFENIPLPPKPPKTKKKN
jgi:hypothetical protein